MTLHKQSGQAGLAGTARSLEHEIEKISTSPSSIITKSPSPAIEDDDYDNCDAWDDAHASDEDQLVWENLSLSPRSAEQRLSTSLQNDKDFDADSEDYESDLDAHASLSMSTDSCSSGDDLSDLPHWWGNEDAGTSARKKKKKKKKKPD